MANYPGKKTYLSLGLILVVIIGTHYLGWLSPLERWLRSLVTPSLGNVHAISIRLGDNWQFFKDKDAFISSYQACMLDQDKDSALAAKVKLLEEENSELKKQLSYHEKNKATMVGASVIGKEIGSLDQILVINKGERDGLRLDQPVIVGEGVLVGKIIKVESDVSLVRLINDNQSRIGASILNTDRSLGVVEGGFGISLQMNMIARDEIVKVGDIVVTSGLEKTIPRGLVLGTVAGVENEAYKPFQKAVLTPGVDLNKLALVSVLVNP